MPILETMQKRKKFLPCNWLEKLHMVFSRYENIVAARKATPFASDGVSSTN